MKGIIIKIKFHLKIPGAILNDISKLLGKYLKRKGIGFQSIDVIGKFDENE